MKKLGPGFLIAAAFIGPGTVTTCIIAGAGYGYQLLWALGLSIIATIILQYMAGKIGLATGKDLVYLVRRQSPYKPVQIFITILILIAILLGNAAYQGGNISGAILGATALLGQNYTTMYTLFFGLVIFSLLWIGNYKVLERFFLGLIALMSVSFILAAIIAKPNIAALFTGLTTPKVNEKNLYTIMALIGTTIVPYNLFLHTALVNQKWSGIKYLKTMRLDTVLSITLGGLVSIAIIIAAAASGTKNVYGVTDLITTLEPLYGNWAKYFFGFGLLAAGLTSSITAPMAAAFVAQSCFGWQPNLKDGRFRIIWISILLVGLAISFSGYTPIQIIQVAQMANAILLPLVAFMLVYYSSKQKLLQQYANATWFSILGGVIVILVMGLTVKVIAVLFQWV